MGNMMSSMWTAVSGLTTSQSAISTTAHNLSNINTKGFTRQQNITTDSNYIKTYTLNGIAKVGLGSATAHIRQLRNAYYDSSYRRENGREGFYEAQYKVASESEQLFGETEGVAFQDVLEDIWTSMEELSKQPESATTRATFVYTVNDFLTQAKDIYGQLEIYQKSLNSDIIQTVKKINDLGDQIFSLNSQIANVEVADIERANDLRDRRNVALDELSHYANIEYYEDNFGIVKVNIEGTAFVEDLSVNKMVIKSNDNDTGLVTPMWSQLDEPVFNPDKFVSITEGTDSGYLKGLLMARGTKRTTYKDIPENIKEPNYPSRADYVNVETGQIDQDAYNEAIKQYNLDREQYKIDLNRYETQRNQYNQIVDVSSVMTVMAEFDKLVNGIVSSINDILSPDQKIQIVDEEGKTKTIRVLDEENGPMGIDEDKTRGEELIVRRSMPRYTQKLFYRDNKGDLKESILDKDGKLYYKDMGGNLVEYPKDSDGNYTADNNSNLYKYRVYNEEDESDRSTLYSISQLEINGEILNDYTKLALAESDGNGGYAYSGVVVDLIGIWDKKFSTLSPNTLTEYTFQEYYTALIGDLGNVGYSMNNMAESQGTLIKEIDDTRQNYMAVSADEELGNLIKFQNAYTAASRYFNVISEMMEHIITQLGS